MKVCILALLAFFIAFAAISISLFTALAKLVTVEFLIFASNLYRTIVMNSGKYPLNIILI